MLKNKPARPAAPAADPPLKKSDRTRAALLGAARTLFAERGYDATTVRDIASAAGADPALVIRYFGNKEDLFIRATEFELHLPDMAAMTMGNEGEMLVRHFFEVWEKGPSATSMQILMRSAITSEAAAQKMQAMFKQQVLPAVARTGPTATAPMRAGLIATQLLGLALCRYVLKLPGIATAPADQLVAAVAPTIQGYLCTLDTRSISKVKSTGLTK